MPIRQCMKPLMFSILILMYTPGMMAKYGNKVFNECYRR